MRVERCYSWQARQHGLEGRRALVIRLPVEVAVEGAIVELAADGTEDLAAQGLATVCVAACLSTGWLPQQLLQ